MKFLSFCMLFFVSTSVYANSCTNITFEEMVTRNNTIILVTNISSVMKYEEFEIYWNDNKLSNNESLDESWLKYESEFEYNEFIINFSYKGELEEGSRIRLFRDYKSYGGNNKIIFFLNDINDELSEEQCIYINTDNEEIIWNGFIVDKLNYKGALNQLLFYKDHKEFSKALFNIKGKGFVIQRVE